MPPRYFAMEAAMRKLATAATAFCAAIFAANYILPLGRLITIAVIAAVLGAALAASRMPRLRQAALALVFLTLGLVYYSAYSERTAAQAQFHSGETAVVGGHVLTYPINYGSYCRTEIKLDCEGLPKLKAIVYADEELMDAKPGDFIRFTGRLSAADTLFGESYDNYHAKGIFFKISAKSAVSIENADFDLRSIPVKLSRLLSERVEKIFPADTAVFMKSLMLGDKSDFYNDDALYCTMSRAGFMHIVAVSGMHVSYLVGLLQFILGRGRRSAVVCIALVWLFVLMTGASPSAVRAGFMQSMLLMAPVLRRENDAVTSLSAILALILLSNPYAAASISLQLSFGAMAGIICFSGKLFEAAMNKLPERMKCRPVRYVLASVTMSAGVTVFTLPVTALHFGYVSLLSFLTNILGLWAVSLCFGGGWLSCALSVVPVLGKAAAWLCSWLARYIVLVAKLISDVPFAVLYMGSTGAEAWMIGSYVLVFTACMIRKRRALWVSAACLLSVSALAALLIANRQFYRNTDTVSVLDVGQGQCITAFAGDATVMIDCGNTYNLSDAGDLAAAYLHSCGRDRIDLLVLTHLHEDHADGVPRLMEMYDIETLIMPEERGDALYEEIDASAAKHGTEVITAKGDMTVTCGGIGMEIYAYLNGGENERCLMSRLTIGSYDVLITADAPEKLEKRLVNEHETDGIETLIVGHHGSKYSSGEELLGAVDGSLAVISVGYNSYGQPAQETLERLAAYGYNVLRTDEDGTIEIRIGQDNG